MHVCARDMPYTVRMRGRHDLVCVVVVVCIFVTQHKVCVRALFWGLLSLYLAYDVGLMKDPHFLSRRHFLLVRAMHWTAARLFILSYTGACACVCDFVMHDERA